MIITKGRLLPAMAAAGALAFAGCGGEDESRARVGGGPPTGVHSMLAPDSRDHDHGSGSEEEQDGCGHSPTAR